ncbi:hypothetical protein VTK56DRAFT_5432 [Thermocarpiscus australiensis]
MDEEEQGRQTNPVDETTSLLRCPSLSVRTQDYTHLPECVRDRDEESIFRNFSPTSESTVDSHHNYLEDGQWKKNVVLLLGVFLVNSDSAILLALFRQIASDFGRLSSASWIINAYLLGLISAQPLYGKLSDIYGRKPLLLIAYACYCVGGLVAGVGFSFWGILLGRAICGVGNAGITVLISALIVDLVPIREVAVWRGYVYAINQVGRAIGPSLGGLITDRTDWRWSLLYQVPLNFAGLWFIWRKVSFPQPAEGKDIDDHSQAGVQSSRLGRIDFAGSTALALANVSLLLFLDRLQTTPGSLGEDLFAVLPMSTWLGFLAVFVVVEGFWAKEPILPPRLLANRNVVSSYAIQFFQTGAQMALYTSVPLYFSVTAGDSSTTAAMRLLIITLGTIAGGLVSGFAIKHTGLYRRVIILAIILSNISFLAVFIRWRGSTGWVETLYGFPIGLAFGVSLSAAYIGLTAGLDASQVAVGTSGFYLCLNLGSLFGVSTASMLISAFVERALQESLSALPDRERRRIIHDVTSSFDRVNELPWKIAQAVLTAYIKSFVNVWVFSLVFGFLALFASFVMREGRLGKQPPIQKRSSRSHSRDLLAQ